MDSGSNAPKKRRRSLSNSPTPSESSSKRLRTVCNGTAFQDGRDFPPRAFLETAIAEFVASHLTDWYHFGLVSKAFRAVSLPILCKIAAEKTWTLRGTHVRLQSPYTRWWCSIHPRGLSSVVLSNELIILTRALVSDRSGAADVQDPRYRILNLADCLQNASNVMNSRRVPVKIGERLVIVSREGVLQRARLDFPERPQIAEIFGDNQQSTQLPSSPEGWSRLASRRAFHFILA